MEKHHTNWTGPERAKYHNHSFCTLYQCPPHPVKVHVEAETLAPALIMRTCD